MNKKIASMLATFLIIAGGVAQLGITSALAAQAGCPGGSSSGKSSSTSKTNSWITGARNSKYGRC